MSDLAPLDRRIAIALLAVLVPVVSGTAETADTADTAGDACGDKPPELCIPWEPEVQGACPELGPREGCSPVTDEGPTYDAGQCCYVVHWEHNSMAAGCNTSHGRPLGVEAVPLLSESSARRAWRDNRLGSPNLAGLTGPDRRRLAHYWASVAIHEHASIASFHRAALEMLAHGAPAELVAAAARAAVDEVRHARRAFTLASAFAGAPVVPAPLPLPFTLPLATSLAELAARTVRDACIEETLSVAAAAAMLDRAEDRVVRRVLSGIIRDETRHATLAWATVRWAMDVGGEPVRAAVREAFAEPQRTQPPDPWPPSPALAAWGCVGDDELAKIVRTTRAAVVQPLAAQLCA